MITNTLDMNHPTIELGATVYFVPHNTEANDCAAYAYEIKRRNIPGFLSGTVIEKGLRWRSVKLDGQPCMERIELLMVKDNAAGNFWSIQANKVLKPDLQTNK